MFGRYASYWNAFLLEENQIGGLQFLGGLKFFLGGYGQCSAGTHPNGMHSYLKRI